MEKVILKMCSAAVLFGFPQNPFIRSIRCRQRKLYRKAVEAAGLQGRETVIDAYCGIGTIGMIAAPYAAKVIGVELNPDAVKDAVSNKKANGQKNIQFYCNDAGRFMREMAGRGEKADVVFMDPPRSGSTEEFYWDRMRIKT